MPLHDQNPRPYEFTESPDEASGAFPFHCPNDDCGSEMFEYTRTERHDVAHYLEWDPDHNLFNGWTGDSEYSDTDDFENYFICFECSYEITSRNAPDLFNALRESMS